MGRGLPGAAGTPGARALVLLVAAKGDPGACPALSTIRKYLRCLGQGLGLLGTGSAAAVAMPTVSSPGSRAAPADGAERGDPRASTPILRAARVLPFPPLPLPRTAPLGTRLCWG